MTTKQNLRPTLFEYCLTLRNPAKGIWIANEDDTVFTPKWVVYEEDNILGDVQAVGPLTVARKNGVTHIDLRNASVVDPTAERGLIETVSLFHPGSDKMISEESLRVQLDNAVEIHEKYGCSVAEYLDKELE